MEVKPADNGLSGNGSKLQMDLEHEKSQSFQPSSPNFSCFKLANSWLHALLARLWLSEKSGVLAIQGLWVQFQLPPATCQRAPGQGTLPQIPYRSVYRVWVSEQHTEQQYRSILKYSPNV
ncbi:hypothetical protein AMECASPLE_037742 [Ameca splendens]|uniref:Uncharacterized protein n=1 Tax=Ameca splendens TaxID=208324 RepID=A0ABV0XX04_9TELE